MELPREFLDRMTDIYALEIQGIEPLFLNISGTNRDFVLSKGKVFLPARNVRTALLEAAKRKKMKIAPFSIRMLGAKEPITGSYEEVSFETDIRKEKTQLNLVKMENWTVRFRLRVLSDMKEAVVKRLVATAGMVGIGAFRSNIFPGAHGHFEILSFEEDTEYKKEWLGKRVEHIDSMEVGESLLDSWSSVLLVTC